jgi:7-cyano-7-deazaguanine synthase in queuosine biosynthesis
MLSGGLDSTLATWYLQEAGFKLSILFANYNQFPLKLERHSTLVCMDILMGTTTAPESYAELDVSLNPEGSYGDRVASLWGRGILLVGLAASWAYTHGDKYDFVALGNHKDDVGPDCKPGEFDLALNQSLKLATKGKMELILPIKDLDTLEVGRELQSRYPVQNCYSCYWDPPCGFRSPNDKYRCPGCRRKSLVLKALGIFGPEEVDRPNCSQISYQSKRAEKLSY